MTRQPIHVSRNVEAPSCNPQFPWKSKILRSCVCCLSYPAWKAHAPYRHIVLSFVSCPVVPYLSTLSNKRHSFRGKKFLSVKCVFWFPPQLLSETFLTLRRNEQDTVLSESRCSHRLRYVYLVVSIEAAVKCAVVSLYSVVKQRLKCNTGKMCNCLITFLLYRRSLTTSNTFYKCTATFRTHCVIVNVFAYSTCYSCQILTKFEFYRRIFFKK
jgi:hypothetical protein